MFTTIERIRQESGFQGDINISDNYIEGYLIQANGVLLGYIASVYDARNFTGNQFTGSQAENVLKRIEELFASGYLLIAEYGPEARDTDKDGYRKLKDAENLCQKIIDGDLRLFDIDSNEFGKKSAAVSGGIVMTSPDYNKNLDPIFTTNMKF